MAGPLTPHRVPEIPQTVGRDGILSSKHEIIAGRKVYIGNYRGVYGEGVYGEPGQHIDVVMTLRSPSGKVITRGTTGAGLHHHLSPDNESWTIDKPEPGMWTVELTGVPLHQNGRQSGLSVFQPPLPTHRPVAAMTLSQDGRTVTVDGSGSTDADGTVTEYMWDFGDGAIKTGPHVTYTYRTAGTYLVELAVRDNTGDRGFGAADRFITITK